MWDKESQAQQQEYEGASQCPLLSGNLKRLVASFLCSFFYFFDSLTTDLMEKCSWQLDIGDTDPSNQQELFNLARYSL